MHLGILPGKLVNWGGKRGIHITSSPHLDADRTEWDSVEIAKTFQRYLVRYPEAVRIQLHILNPNSYKGLRWTYEYDRASEAVVIFIPFEGSYSTTEPIDDNFDSYIRGERSLNTRHLRRN